MEGIIYRLLDKSLEIWFTWVEGSRIYTETIAKWDDNSVLTNEEKKKVFTDVLDYVAKKREKPIIVINSDDPSKELWEQLCSENQSLIRDLEYTSNEKQYQNQREMYLDILKAGKGLVIHGTEIRNEKELDTVLDKLRESNAS